MCGGLFKHWRTAGKRELQRGTSAAGQIPTRADNRSAKRRARMSVSAAVSAAGDVFVGRDYVCHTGFRKGGSPDYTHRQQLPGSNIKELR